MLEIDESYEMLMSRLSHSELREVIESGIDINLPDTYGCFMLCAACEQIQLDNVEFLLSKGANLECKNPNTNTPLLCVIDCVSRNPTAALGIVTALLDAGADLEARGYMDKTPFLRACSRGDLNILKLLVSRGCNIHAESDDMGYSNSGLELAKMFDATQEFKDYLNDIYQPKPSER